MTANNGQTLSMHAEIRALRDGVMNRLDDVNMKLARVEAVLEESKQRHEAEIRALFEKNAQADERLRKVELNYIPRNEHEEDLKSIRTRLDEIAAGQSQAGRELHKLELGYTKLLGGVAVVVAVIEFAMRFLLPRMMGGQ